MALSQNQIAVSYSKSFIAGEVIGVYQEHWRVLIANEFVTANLAASCLVAPQKGSPVLLAYVEGQYYILAVLTHPAKTLKLAAEKIELASQALLIHNKATEIKTNHLRFDVRRLVSLAKRAYAEFGQFWQKSHAMQVETKQYQLKTEFLHESTKGLSYREAAVLSEKAKINSVQADKVLLN